MADESARATRVLITTDWWMPAVNGVVASVLTLKPQLEQLGHDVRVLTLSTDRHSRREGDVFFLGSVSATAIYENARVGVPLNERIEDALEHWRPDVVHSQCEFTTFVWARRLCRELQIPLVHTYHTIYEDYTHYISLAPAVGRRFAATFSRRSLNKTDLVIAPTDKVKLLLESYGVHTPVRVIPTGLDLDKFSRPRDPDDIAALKAQLGVPAGNDVLLVLGRLAEEKNINEVIDHFARLGRPNTTLLIVGDGPVRGDLEDQVRHLQLGRRVIFAGRVPPEQTGRYYALADLFVSASRSETQGLTYIEALASGLPAVCAKDPAIDGVVVDGLNGWQFTDYDTFMMPVTALLGDDDLRARVSAAAARWAAEKYSAQHFGSAVAAAYRQAIADHQA